MATVWTVEATASRRFPYRIAVEQEGRLVLAVRAQSSWPGPGQQIFCLRERSLDPDEALEALERVPVLQIGRVGRKLSLVLDRPTRKRCEFLSVSKLRRNGAGEYEQVFFRTESGIRAHRSRTRLELTPPTAPLTVVIDSGERYPWRFPGAAVVRRKLAVGDYAVEAGGRLLAVVERKSFDNLLTDLGSVQALHHQLHDLAGCDAAAVVIEAQYGDFLSEARLAGRWPPAFTARALAELGAMHPRLPLVYAGNRKLANLWTDRFFRAALARAESPELDLVREARARYDPEPRGAGLDAEIRAAVLSSTEAAFRIQELAARLPEAPMARLRRVVELLRREGRLRRVGAGRAARWERRD